VTDDVTYVTPKGQSRDPIIFEAPYNVTVPDGRMVTMDQP